MKNYNGVGSTETHVADRHERSVFIRISPSSITASVIFFSLFFSLFCSQFFYFFFFTFSFSRSYLASVLQIFHSSILTIVLPTYRSMTTKAVFLIFWHQSAKKKITTDEAPKLTNPIDTSPDKVCSRSLH